MAAALGLILLALSGCGEDEPVLRAEAPPAATEIVRSTPPVIEAGDVAARVHYAGDGSREWGTLCRLPGGGYVSVHHVTVNGTPVVGPQDEVTAFREASDWSILGRDPASLDPASFPALSPGDSVMVAGFPARDIDGEVAPGKVYLEDTTPPFIWVELLPLPGGGPPEGAVGGQSGSCVLKSGKVVGVVQANGFSRIPGTTSTWVKIVPMADILTEYRGEANYETRALSLLRDTRPRPIAATGRFSLRGE